MRDLVFDFDSFFLLLFCFRFVVHYYYYNDLQNFALSSRVDIWALQNYVLHFIHFHFHQKQDFHLKSFDLSWKKSNWVLQSVLLIYKVEWSFPSHFWPLLKAASFFWGNWGRIENCFMPKTKLQLPSLTKSILPKSMIHSVGLRCKPQISLL